MTQTEIVLDVLKGAGKRGITAFDALRYNIFRLGARVYDLRRLGYEIRTILEFHGTESERNGMHARYILERAR